MPYVWIVVILVVAVSVFALGAFLNRESTAAQTAPAPPLGNGPARPVTTR